MLQRVRQSSELQTALTWSCINIVHKSRYRLDADTIMMCRCQHVQRRLTHAADRFATTRWVSSTVSLLGGLGCDQGEVGEGGRVRKCLCTIYVIHCVDLGVLVCECV